MRLDKLLAHLGYGSRKEIKALIRKGNVFLNGKQILDDDIKVNEEVDEIVIHNQKVMFQKNLYFLLNKPKGYVCANYDDKDPTVFDLIFESQKGLFSIGRLDKDTTGVLLITNDGKLAHHLLSYKNHVAKIYEVEFLGTFSSTFYKKFQEGIILEDGSCCKPAKFELLESQKGNLTIYEGKYHQVKRMFLSLGLEVISLKRISFGGIDLPMDLEEGKYRQLSLSEIELLRKS